MILTCCDSCNLLLLLISLFLQFKYALFTPILVSYPPEEFVMAPGRLASLQTTYLDNTASPQQEQQQLRHRRHADTEVDYRSAEETCQHFQNKRLVCNENDVQRSCVCALPPPETSFGQFDPMRTCDNMSAPFPVLPQNSLAEYVLTFGIDFPVPHQFLDHPDEIFLEDIELFTRIPRQSIIILRKGCDEGQKSFEFQIGILDTSHIDFAKGAMERPALRSLSPDIFLNNNMFMEENGLLIEYVKPAHQLRPIQPQVDEQVDKMAVNTSFKSLILYSFCIPFTISFFVFMVLTALFLYRRMRNTCSGYNLMPVRREDSSCVTSSHTCSSSCGQS